MAIFTVALGVGANTAIFSVVKVVVKSTVTGQNRIDPASAIITRRSVGVRQ